MNINLISFIWNNRSLLQRYQVPNLKYVFLLDALKSNQSLFSLYIVSQPLNKFLSTNKTYSSMVEHDLGYADKPYSSMHGFTLKTTSQASNLNKLYLLPFILLRFLSFSEIFAWLVVMVSKVLPDFWSISLVHIFVEEYNSKYCNEEVCKNHLFHHMSTSLK